MDTLISIIVPIYNVEQYLEKCIKSIINQTYTNLEIILVDDGSKDSSFKICSNFNEDDRRVTLIHKENGGLVSARKAGIEIATGEYVGYVDADDWIEPDFIETLARNILNTDVDVVESNFIIETTDRIERLHSGFMAGVYEAGEIRKHMLCDREFIECKLGPSLCTKLFRRDVLKEMQLAVDERIDLGEDAAVTYPFLLKCNSISIVDYAGYHYVQRPSSISYENMQNKEQAIPYVIPYLEKVFNAYDGLDKDIILWQLEQYKKLIYLEYCPQVLDENVFLSTFGGIDKNSKIVIYGAGRMGKSIYHYIQRVCPENLYLWVDRNWEQINCLGYNVVSPEELVSENINKKDIIIIVAIFNRRVVKKIIEYLCDRGIKNSKIKPLIIYEGDNLIG